MVVQRAPASKKHSKWVEDQALISSPLLSRIGLCVVFAVGSTIAPCLSDEMSYFSRKFEPQFLPRTLSTCGRPLYRKPHPFYKKTAGLLYLHQRFVTPLPPALPCICGPSLALQHQRFLLEHESSLVLVDWMTSGRMSRGEGWAFNRFESRNEVMVQQQQVYSQLATLSHVFQQNGVVAAGRRRGEARTTRSYS